MQETERLVPIRLQYHGDPKRFISVLLKAIDEGRLLYDGHPNFSHTLRILSTVIDVMSSTTGQALSPETIQSYAKKEHNGDFVEYYDGVFDIDYIPE